MGRTKELFEELRLQDANNEFFNKKIFYATLEETKNCDKSLLESIVRG
jgi:hypothetical protein